MKQGPSTSKPGQSKSEPKPKAIGPGAVSRMGNQTVYTKAPAPMAQGRGFKAPMAAKSHHPSGSQKKH
jgi:hypothetical protein